MAQSEAQLITAGLYLGPHQVAQDSVTLAQLGVTRVMSVLGPDQDFDRVAVPAENKSWVQVTDRVEAEIEMARELPAAVERLLEWEVHRQHVSIKPAQPRPQCTCMYHMRTIARMLTRSLDGFTCSCASEFVRHAHDAHADTRMPMYTCIHRPATVPLWCTANLASHARQRSSSLS